MLTATDNEINLIKWRCDTVELLIKLEKEADRTKHCKTIVSDLLVWPEFFQLGLKSPIPEILQAKLKDTVSSAVLLARIFSRQRAVYELQFPDKCRLREDDELMTNVGSEVGVEGFPEEESFSGEVRSYVTPALLKFGDGNGSNLSHCSCLVKALVSLEYGKDMQPS